ncbi:hypothetical protein CSHISOI_10681, partial [Colletotrichum shisoi]
MTDDVELGMEVLRKSYK